MAGTHYLIKIAQFSQPLSGMEQLIANAQKMLPITELVSKGESHALATGKGSFLFFFRTEGRLIVEAYSTEAVMIKGLKELIIKHFSLGFNQIELLDLGGVRGRTAECEEPGCVRPATDEYQGRKVCADHLDYYREKEFQMRSQHEY